MNKKHPDRPAHCPRNHEWLPDAYKRDVEPLGVEARELMREAFAEEDIEVLFLADVGDQYPLPTRMWRKASLDGAYAAFETGRMQVKREIEKRDSPYDWGWVFVPVGVLGKALRAKMGANEQGEQSSSKYENWTDQQDELCGQGMSLRKAAEKIANDKGVDPATVERETRRVRRDRGGKTGS